MCNVKAQDGKKKITQTSPAMYSARVFLFLCKIHSRHVTSVCNGNHIFYLFNTNPPEIREEQRLWSPRNRKE